MITTIIDCTLTAESRPGQMTNETVRESTRERLATNPPKDPHMRASAEQVLEPGYLQRWGRYSNGNRFTMLRVDHEGQRLEISVVGDKMVDRAVELEPGAKLRITCELLGEEPYLRLRARRIAVMPTT